jgi:hypothetical protein|tara:strand:- start:55 stop:342 length:288 start_codon:yes stop_codon:yes gene_type:complete
MNETLLAAMLEDAKQVNKRAKQRDGQSQFLKQNLANDYNMGGRQGKPETKEIIKLALEGKSKDFICRRMAFLGYSRIKTLKTLCRHADKINNLKH